VKTAGADPSSKPWISKSRLPAPRCGAGTKSCWVALHHDALSTASATETKSRRNLEEHVVSVLLVLLGQYVEPPLDELEEQRL
jgi:hypothetical protein